MERNFVFVSSSSDAYENLARDEWFLDHVGENDLILHLYQNENAVIIGKNQNPWLECDLAAMERDGVQLVRRVSGGGAVYHDGGNLNFSFVAGGARYDVERQFAMIASSLRELGLEVNFSGRNDLLLGEKKISGNAFADRKGKKQHHGTLLVDSDLEKLSRYLTVDPKKIRSKGISSVRSRVCNLRDASPTLTVKGVKKSLLKGFEREYGYYGEWLFSAAEREEVAAYRAHCASDEWRLGQTPKFDLEWKERFPWGGIQLFFSFEKGKIARVDAFSDAMNPAVCQEVVKRLTGVDFNDAAISAALSDSPFEEARCLADCSFLP